MILSYFMRNATAAVLEKVISSSTDEIIHSFQLYSLSMSFSIGTFPNIIHTIYDVYIYKEVYYAVIQNFNSVFSFFYYVQLVALFAVLFKESYSKENLSDSFRSQIQR